MSDEMISDGEWLQQAQPGWTAVEFPHEIVQDNFVSGDTNGRRLTVRYFRSDAEACLVAKVLFGPEAQGPPGHAHGGSMAALLDELMGGAAWMSGHMVVSAELTIRFKTMLPLRSEMQIVFQDPYASLNPRFTVEQTIMEPLLISGKFSHKASSEEAERLMDMVGIDQRLRLAYPHELDGGRRQRVGIARALALNPKFIVCDEPVSALDVSIQAQVLNLLQDLQDQHQLTYMFVTHDLSVVRHISDDICVMYLGVLVETCESKELFRHPLHPYTQALISAVPTIDIHHKRERVILQGEISSPINPKPGCRFRKRCIYKAPECYQAQELVEILPQHFVACCRAKEINHL